MVQQNGTSRDNVKILQISVIKLLAGRILNQQCMLVTESSINEFFGFLSKLVFLTWFRANYVMSIDTPSDFFNEYFPGSGGISFITGSKLGYTNSDNLV